MSGQNLKMLKSGGNPDEIKSPRGDYSPKDPGKRVHQNPGENRIKNDSTRTTAKNDQKNRAYLQDSEQNHIMENSRGADYNLIRMGQEIIEKIHMEKKKTMKIIESIKSPQQQAQLLDKLDNLELPRTINIEELLEGFCRLVEITNEAICN